MTKTEIVEENKIKVKINSLFFFISLNLYFFFFQNKNKKLELWVMEAQKKCFLIGFYRFFFQSFDQLIIYQTKNFLLLFFFYSFYVIKAG